MAHKNTVAVARAHTRGRGAQDVGPINQLKPHYMARKRDSGQRERMTFKGEGNSLLLLHSEETTEREQRERELFVFLHTKSGEDWDESIKGQSEKWREMHYLIAIKEGKEGVRSLLGEEKTATSMILPVFFSAQTSYFRPKFPRLLN